MVSEKKKEIVKQIVGLVKKYPIIGVVNMSGLPAPQLQIMREALRKDVELVMARKKLMTKALETAGKENVADLINYFRGVPALLFTESNPFQLYRVLEKSKSPAPAKAGQVAPKDIVVKAGATPFAPGPIIGELGAIGIKTGVEGGKVAVKQDSTVVREGETIKPKVAEVLKRLNIEPMEIGLDLVVAWEKGTIFKGSDLRIDEEEYMSNIVSAAQWAVNLSVESGYPTADTIELMIIKAFRDSKAVALEGNVLADEVLGEVLAKVEREALSLKAEAGVATVEKPKEEPKVEEKKEEPKPEPAKEEVKEELEAPEPPQEVKEEVSEKPEEAEEPKAKEEEEERPEPETEEPVGPMAAHMPEELRDPDKVPGDIEIKTEEYIPEIKEEVKEEKKEKGFFDIIKKDIHKIEDSIAPCFEHVAGKKVELPEKEVMEEAEKEYEKLKGKIEGEEIESKEELMEKLQRIKETLAKIKKEQEVPPSVKLMVEKTKKFAKEGKGPSAADLLEETEEEPEEEVKEEKKEEVPTAQELYNRLQKKGTLRTTKTDNVPSAHELMKQKQRLKKS